MRRAAAMLLAVCAMTVCALAVPVKAARLVIHVTHVSPKGGIVSLALYTKANYDDDAHPTASRDVPAHSPETVVTIDGIAPGIYAVKSFQDINRNGKFDSDFLGLPLEPYGFSDNATPVLSEPGFSRTRFVVRRGETDITIRLSGTDGMDPVPPKTAGTGAHSGS